MYRPLLRLALAAVATTAQAASLPEQGTWQHTLAARNLQGQAVALDSADAAFFYDTTLGVTWLRQASAPALMSWADATAWAAAQQPGGLGGWRLPQVLDLGAPGCTRFTYQGGDCGYNVPLQAGAAYSELAHLFYVTLGNQAAYTPTGVYRGDAGQGQSWGLVNTAQFSGLQGGLYWSGSTASNAPGWAFSFDTRFGFQTLLDKPRQHQVLLLRDGDVLAAVPEPATVLLWAATGLLWCARRWRARG